MIGMPHYGGGIPAKTALSLAATTRLCERMGIASYVTIRSGLIEMARDGVCADFIESGAGKLFCIDSDMVWDPTQFIRMLALSTLYDVICASYPVKIEGPATEFYVSWKPGQPASEHGLLPVLGAGLGFTVIDRKVIAELSAKAPPVLDQIGGLTVPGIHRVDVVDGHRRTEDMALFADITALGYQVWLDPSIPLGHIGAREWTGRLLDAIVDKHAKPSAAA